MLPEIVDVTPEVQIPLSELQFSFARSGGKGGQNVNKVETKVELRFDVATSPSLTDEQRARITERLAARLDADGVLRLSASEARGQYANRVRAVERLRQLLRAALAPPAPPRRPTRATRGSVERRIAAKKVRATRKQNRTWRPDE